MDLDVERLISACGDRAEDAGITITTSLAPLAGPHAPVKPAVYAGGVFQEDRRWWGDPVQRTDVIVIDNVPSEANRLEAALQRMRKDLGLPEIVLDLSALATLPPHLPTHLSSYRFAHRQADAYLRDAVLEDGKTRFIESHLGASLFNASAAAPAPILLWFPQALLYGFWQSHLGNKRSQAKLARSWVSEIVGFGPATGSPATRTRPLGLKGDDLNLSVEEQAEFNEIDLAETPWALVEGSTKKVKAPAGESRKALSEIGHGQVPIGGPKSTALSGVSFLAIEQHATLSLPMLRRLHFGDEEQTVAGRALLAALGIVAHAAAFGGALALRSGCDLRTISAAWTWCGATGDTEVTPVDLNTAMTIFRACREKAAAVHLLDGGGWGDSPLRLKPGENLARAIVATWPRPALGA